MIAIGKNILPISGGKGGIGKSVIAANLAISLALNAKRLHRRVIVMDCDFGSSNLSSLLNITNQSVSLRDFLLNGKSKLNDIVLGTHIDSLKVINSRNNPVDWYELLYSQRMRLIRHIMKLEADYIILDLGAGTANNVIDFFLISDEGIVVLNPEPCSVLSTYNLLKKCIYRKLAMEFRGEERGREIVSVVLQWINGFDFQRSYSLLNLYERIDKIDKQISERVANILKEFRPKLIVNKVEKKRELEFGSWFKSSVKQRLGIDLDYIGFIYYSDEVKISTKKLKTVFEEFPAGTTVKCLDSIAKNILGIEKGKWYDCTSDIQLFKVSDGGLKKMGKALGQEWKVFYSKS